MPDHIPSPYNFVPLSEKVFFPDRSEQVSMDIPFSDGISGTLELKVTAKTPIYIRNGGAHPKKDKKDEGWDDKYYKDFFQVFPGGPYAIPGSSLKGMLRAVLEIASFGKMVGGAASSRVSEHRYAIRDLTPDARDVYGQFLTVDVDARGQPIQGGRASEKYWKPRAQAGWLEQLDDSWLLFPCRYSRIKHEDIKGWNCKVGDSGPDKYKKWPGGVDNTKILFTPGPEMPQGGKFFYSMAADIGSGNTEGDIVFTGQPSPKKKKEFVFYGVDPRPINVDDIRKDFIDAHTIGDKPQANWDFWKDRLKGGHRIPVFYLVNDQGIPTSMGLAMMYRFPFKCTIHDAIRNTSAEHLNEEKRDFCETLFGRVEKKDGLKGRVSCEALLCENGSKGRPEVHTILNTPKPTFYPNYLCQGMNGSYTTLMDKGAKIRGWKRYIVAPDGTAVPQDRQHADHSIDDKESVATRFTPLPAETTFSGTLHVHNVRPYELGALIWAITWGQRPFLRHTIGMGKPYGFGAITVEIVGRRLGWCNPLNNDAIPEDKLLMSEFEASMELAVKKWLGVGWINSDPMRSLMAMADPSSQWAPQAIRYPRLSEKEFKSCQNKGLRLRSDLPAVWGKNEKQREPKAPPKSAEDRVYEEWQRQGRPTDDRLYKMTLASQLGVLQLDDQAVKRRMLEDLFGDKEWRKKTWKRFKDEGKGPWEKLCALDAEVGLGMFRKDGP